MHEFAVLKFKDGVSKEEQFETMKGNLAGSFPLDGFKLREIVYIGMGCHSPETLAETSGKRATKPDKSPRSGGSLPGQTV